MQRARGDLRAALRELEARVDADPEVANHDDDSAVDDGSSPALSDADLARLRNLEELLRLANEYMSEDPSSSAAGFEAWLNATVGSDDGSSGGDAVDVATFHAAKGLEWPVVHLAGLETGLVPIGRAQMSEELAEERRLFYVAVTRAERDLILHWAEHRTFGNRQARRRPSPFVEEIEPVLDALRRGAEPADIAEYLPAVRETVRAARGTKGGTRAAASLTAADQALFEELRRWRSKQAKAAAVPAFVIFDDKTLTEVASRRPSDRAALLRVPGIGPVKLERYGADLLAVLAQY
jgi:DNA helicase-2/ATP-dependent DNA helicase PcrA